jgi:hypothetical protein
MTDRFLAVRVPVLEIPDRQVQRRILARLRPSEASAAALE